MITLGTVSTAPGEMGTGRLEVSEPRDGRSIDLPIAIISSTPSGKILYM